MATAVQIEDVRLAIFDTFRHTGQAPSVPSLSATLGMTPDAVGEAMHALHAHRDIVLDAQANNAMA